MLHSAGRYKGRFAGDTRKVEIAPGVGMEFVWVAPGSFKMGSGDGDSDEMPVHRVTLTKGYWLGKFEVTQAERRNVNGGEFYGADRGWKRVLSFSREVHCIGGRLW